MGSNEDGKTILSNSVQSLAYSATFYFRFEKLNLRSSNLVFAEDKMFVGQSGSYFIFTGEFI